MAINYEPVGWDTSKFVNPTNMNQMDNGIKEACDGVDKLVNSILDTIAEVEANTEEKKIAGALALKAYMKHVIENFLPLTGGTLSGSLFIDNGYTKVDGGTGGSSLVSYSEPKGASFRTITIKDNAELGDSASIYNQKNDGTSRAYNIFGEHNKPSGSYTGNGSATRREINVGGIYNDASILLITGTMSSYIVTHFGAIMIFHDGNDYGNYSADNACFRNGVLILNTDGSINQSGVTFTYQLL